MTPNIPEYDAESVPENNRPPRVSGPNGFTSYTDFMQQKASFTKRMYIGGITFFLFHQENMVKNLLKNLVAGYNNLMMVHRIVK